MKAVLIIDTPDKCEECPLIYWTISGWACKPTKSIIEEDVKPNWCPLKNLPQKKSIELACQKEAVGNDYGAGLIVGWNDCLKELEHESSISD